MRSDRRRLFATLLAGPREPGAPVVPALRLLLFVAILLTCQAGPARAAEDNAPVVAQIRPAGVQAWRTAYGQQTRQRLAERQRLEAKDLVTTGPDAWVQLFFPPACQVWIGPNSQVLVDNLRPEVGAGGLHLLLGRVRATIGSLLGLPEQHFTLTAESVFAAPRGTDFLVERVDGAIEVTVFEGQVEVGGPGGERVLAGPGEAIRAQLEGRIGPPERPPAAQWEQKRRTSQPGLQLIRPGLGLEIPGGTTRHPPEPPAPIERFEPPVVAPPRGPWQVELDPG